MVDLSQYDLGSIRTAISNPRAVKNHAKQIMEENVRDSTQLENALYRMYGGPVDVMSEDWDNLIILDACRRDLFEEVNFIDGETKYAASPASSSYPFIQSSFKGRQLHDTVYVTGNAHSHKIETGTFFKIVNTYRNREDLEKLYEQRTPEKVTEIATRTHLKHPNKRLITHFMQPHIPYIGSKAREKYTELSEGGITLKSQEYLRREDPNENGYDATSFLPAAKKGLITDSELRELYRENLTTVLESVSDLLERLNGKSIITADHGELLGERPWLSLTKRYGHPDIVSPETRLVPWHVIDNKQRREVSSDSPIETDTVERETVEDQLRALGYK